MLKISNLEKSYKAKGIQQLVLKGIDISVQDGEFVSIMGPSGSGKTTLLNVISGFIKADCGEVFLDNDNILNSNEDDLAEIRQYKLGFVFQDFMLVSGLTVKENIFLPQIIVGKKIKQMKEITDQILKTFGIEDLSDKYPSEISGGQKQRVAIARALSNQPSIVFADEPTGNLDSKSSQSVIDTFVSAKTQMGATILMVTHDVFAASYCDRVIALKDGMVAGELIRKVQPKIFIDELLDFTKKVNGGEFDNK